MAFTNAAGEGMSLIPQRRKRRKSTMVLRTLIVDVQARRFKLLLNILVLVISSP